MSSGIARIQTFLAIVSQPLQTSLKMKKCHNCGEAWTADRKLPFRETCARCGRDLHCCLNCRLYDLHASHECRSPTTEWVSDKDKKNFCEEFEFAEDKGPAADEQKDKGRKTWDDLWKQSPD